MGHIYLAVRLTGLEGTSESTSSHLITTQQHDGETEAQRSLCDHFQELKIDHGDGYSVTDMLEAHLQVLTPISSLNPNNNFVRERRLLPSSVYRRGNEGSGLFNNLLESTQPARNGSQTVAPESVFLPHSPLRPLHSVATGTTKEGGRPCFCLFYGFRPRPGHTVGAHGNQGDSRTWLCTK